MNGRASTPLAYNGLQHGDSLAFSQELVSADTSAGVLPTLPSCLWPGDSVLDYLDTQQSSSEQQPLPDLSELYALCLNQSRLTQSPPPPQGSNALHNITPQEDRSVCICKSFARRLDSLESLFKDKFSSIEKSINRLPNSNLAPK